MSRPLFAAALLVTVTGCNSILGIGELHVAGGAADANPHQPDAPVDAVPAPITAAAVSADYVGHKGRVARLDVRAETITPDVIANVNHGDPVVRHSGNELLIVNRFGDDIVVLDAATFALIDTFTLPANSNPQDVAAAGTKLYVPALASTGLIIVDRSNHQTKTIPLLQSDDPDGHPDCVSAFYTGSKIFVACGLLDASFMPRKNGKIAVVDPFNDMVSGSYDLPFKNPFGLIAATHPASPGTGDLLIGTTPSFTDFSTGCIVRLGATQANGCLVTNQAIGGGASRIDVDPDGSHIWIASGVYDSVTFQIYGRLVSFDVAANQLAAPTSAPGQEIIDVAACPDGYVIAADQKSGAHGVRIYHAGATSALLDLGQPPVPSGLACY